MTSSTKVHVTLGNQLSLCGHGKPDAIKPLSEFFSAEADQCASCLKKVGKRGYQVAALRKRYQRLTPAAPVQTPALAQPARKSAAQPGLYTEIKRTAVELFDKTIAQIERAETDIRRFERLCGQLRECGFAFAPKVTPHPYAIQYNLRLDAAQSKRLSELLTKLADMGYTDHDPAFPNITGMRALEITGPGAPTFTVHYPRQARPALGTLAHTLALRQLEEASHAHRHDQ